MVKATKEKAAKPKDLDELRNICNKDHGENSLIMGNDAIVEVDVFPSMIATLDEALGTAGIPQGRIIEIYGNESSGKTTTCLQIISACQKYYFEDKDRYGVAAFIDAEHAVDPTWAQLIGVNWDKLLFSQPNSGEQALQIADKMASSGLVDLIVVDSVAALVPQSELDGEIGDSSIGAQARLMSQAMRKFDKICGKNKCTIIFINQVREKIGVMFGNPETTPGGKALKFYASIRMSISKGSKLTKDKGVEGFETKIKIIKTKVGGKPMAQTEYKIYSGDPVSGIDIVDSIITVATKHNIITSKGSHYYYDGQSLGNGIANASDALRNNEEIMANLTGQIYGKFITDIESKKSKAKMRSQEHADGPTTV